VQTLSARIDGLPLEDLMTSATGVLGTADSFLASEAMTDLPPSLTASLDQLRLVMGDIRASGVIPNANEAIVAVRSLTDDLAAARLGESLKATLASAEAAAAQVSTASEDLPVLIDNLTALSQRVGELPLDELVTSGTRVLGTADAFLASEGVESVPPRLAASLEELRLVLAELREGGAVANVNATLASADEAAAAITAAAADLPALVAQFSRVAAQADIALAQVGPGSEVNRETLLLLREVRDAAKSVSTLATALQRQPNSVLFGR
jgi:paraquat-inducible protein B